MPSAAAALGLGEEAIRRMGRWQPGQVTDAYVRTTVASVIKAQAHIAERVRAGGADFLGEAAELSKLARYLRLKGHAEEVVVEAIRNLEHFREATSGNEEESDAERGDPEDATEADAEEVEAPEHGDGGDLGPSDHDSETGDPTSQPGEALP